MRLSPKRSVNVISRLASEIADIARYGGEPTGGITPPGGNVAFNDPTGNQALRTGAAREWLDRWQKVQRELDVLANAALRIGPPVKWPLCSLCGMPVVGEDRQVHNACSQKARRKVRSEADTANARTVRLSR